MIDDTPQHVVIMLSLTVLIVVLSIMTYYLGWDKGYRASLVDVKKGLPPKWVITQRDDGTSGWELNSKRIKSER